MATNDGPPVDTKAELRPVVSLSPEIHFRRPTTCSRPSDEDLRDSDNDDQRSLSSFLSGDCANVSSSAATEPVVGSIGVIESIPKEISSSPAEWSVEND